MAKEPHSFSLLPRVPLCGELRNEAPLKQGVAVCSVASQSPPSGSLPEALGFYLLHTGVPTRMERAWKGMQGQGLNHHCEPVPEGRRLSSSLCLCRRPEEGGDTCEVLSPGRRS